jgi:hypothetical protein
MINDQSTVDFRTLSDRVKRQQQHKDLFNWAREQNQMNLNGGRR